MVRKMTSAEKTKFEELRALKVLQLLFPEKYRGASLWDAPDIINRELNIGVEVTSSMKQKVQQGASRVSELTGKKPADFTERNFAQMGAEGVNVFSSPTDEVLAVFTYWGNLHSLVGAYRNKMTTLNKPHFSALTENNLFIIAWLIDQGELESGVRGLLNCQGKGDEPDGRLSFDYIYILTEGLLIEIDLNKAVVSEHLVDKEHMNIINHSAFKHIFGVSRDEYYGRCHSSSTKRDSNR